jgi:hypothetical protein
MRGEAERGGSAWTQNPAVWWVRMLIPVPSTRRSRTKPTPVVHRAASPAAPMPRSGRRGRPDSFGYEPFMCAWEHQHTEHGHATATPKARPPRRPA